MAETLTKFGVPLGGGQGRGGLLQLKYKYRFRVRMINFGPIAGGLELSNFVQSVDRPTLTHDIVEVHSYNSRAYFAGKHEFGTIGMVLKDDMTNNVAKLVGHQTQKQLNHFEQTGFAAGVNYKFLTLIETMDGGNDTVLETWTLEGCWLSETNFSNLDYTSTNEFQTIELTIRYDNATMADGLMTRLPEYIPGNRI